MFSPAHERLSSFACREASANGTYRWASFSGSGPKMKALQLPFPAKANFAISLFFPAFLSKRKTELPRYFNQFATISLPSGVRIDSG